MTIKGTSTIGAVVTAVLLLAACTATPSVSKAPATAGLERFMTQELAFGACDPAVGGPLAKSLAGPQLAASRCAMLEVPLDYEQPAGDTIQLAVLRVPATGDDRIGSVVVNPGGPGVPATSYAPILAAVWAKSPVVQRFDIVGFDTRGVGLSRPAINCYTDQQRDEDAPVSAIGRWTETTAHTIVKQCAAGSGGEQLLGHVGTRDTARDLDVLRAALGDDQLSFAGTSYGTRLGAVYAEMFPTKVRALLLDGPVDPQKNTRERQVQIATGVQRSFEQLAASCAEQKACPLGDDPAKATAAAQRLLRPLVDEPIRTAHGREVLFSMATEGIVAGLYDEAQWPRVIAGLAELRQGRADTLLALRDEYQGRTEAGVYPDDFEALLAINCMDEERLTPEQTTALLHEVRVAAPVLDPGVLSETHDGCEAWPAEPTLGFPYASDVKGLPQSLVVAVTGDPVTPYEGGIQLADSLGGQLLTVDGEQHGATVSRNPCVDRAVTDYLIDLKLPKQGARCSL